MPEYSINWKADNDTRSTKTPASTQTYIYVADDDDALRVAAELEAVSNAKVTSIRKKLDLDPVPVAPFGNVTADGGTTQYRASFSNDQRHNEQVNIPFKKNNVSDEVIENLLEALPLLNREGEDIGQWVKAVPVQRVDGPAVGQPANDGVPAPVV